MASGSVFCLFLFCFVVGFRLSFFSERGTTLCWGPYISFPPKFPLPLFEVLAIRACMEVMVLEHVPFWIIKKTEKTF